MSDSGLAQVRSAYDVAETIDRLSKAAGDNGLLIFARIDHAAGAENIGMSLRPTELLIFGHPRGGTAVMLDRQTAGLDLPLRALAWEDEAGRVWLTYNDGDWFADRHELSRASSTAVTGLHGTLSELVAEAAGVVEEDMSVY